MKYIFYVLWCGTPRIEYGRVTGPPYFLRRTFRCKIWNFWFGQDPKICWKSTFFIFGNTSGPAIFSKTTKKFRFWSNFDFISVFHDFESSYLPRFRVSQKMKTLHPGLVTVIERVFFCKKSRKNIHWVLVLKGESSILTKIHFVERKTTHPMLRANHSNPAEFFMKIAHFWLLFSNYTWELNFTKRKIMMIFTSLLVFLNLPLTSQLRRIIFSQFFRTFFNSPLKTWTSKVCFCEFLWSCAPEPR